MSELSREISRVVREVLDIKPCPFCGGEVRVGDCGHSSFNSGFAICKKCSLNWDLGYVASDWEAGECWNRLQPEAIKVEKAKANFIKACAKAGVSPRRTLGQ